MKWFCAVLILFPAAIFAQLPIPLTPDWLKGGDNAFGLLHGTQVELAGSNYRLLQTNLIAKSYGFKLLGLITLKSPSYVQAMSRLYGAAHMEEGHPQALANVVHEQGGLNLILFSIPRIEIRADLIEFIDTEDDPGSEDAKPLRARTLLRRRER